MNEEIKNVFKLTSPIDSIGEVVTEIKLRTPLMGDIAKCGGKPSVLRVDPVTEEIIIEENVPRILKMIEVLGNLGSGAANKLIPEDYEPIKEAIMGFFNPTPKT